MSKHICMRIICSLSLISWLCFTLCTPLYAAKFIEPHSIYEIINENKDAGLYNETIEFLDSIILHESFQDLSCYDKGKIYHALATSHYFLDNELKAINTYKDKTLQEWEDCAAVSANEKANTIYNIGVCYQYISEPELAAEYMNSALAILQNLETVDSISLAKKYQGAGNYYADIKDYERATSAYELAISIWNSMGGGELNIVKILNRSLLLNIELGEYQIASDYFSSAIQILESSTIPSYETSLLYLNGAHCYVKLEKYQLAKKYANIALTLIDRHSNMREYSIAMEILGAIHLSEKNYAKAKHYFDETLKIRAQLESTATNDFNMALAHENLSEYYLLTANLSEANAEINNAIRKLHAHLPIDSTFNLTLGNRYINHPLDLLRMLKLKSQILFETNSISNQNKIESILTKMDTILVKTISSSHLELSKLQMYNAVYEYMGTAVEYCLTFNSNKDLSLSYKYASSAKAMIFNSYQNIRKFVLAIKDETVQSKENRIISEINTTKQLINYSEANNDSLLTRYVQLQYELENFYDSIGVSKNLEDQFLRNGYLTKDQVQTKLNQDEVLIEFFQSSSNLYAFLITKSSIDIHKFNKKELNPIIQVFINHIRHPDVSLNASDKKRLWSHFVGPLFDGIDNKNNIIIIPDGLIHQIPFESLYQEDGSFLIEKFSFQYILANYFLNTDTPLISKSKSFLGFGTNYSEDLNNKLELSGKISHDYKLSTLRSSEHEITDLSQSYDASVFTGTKATLSNFLTADLTSDILHLSLHGIVNHQDPYASYIVFDTNEDDFLLSSAQISNLQMSPNLVVLSSCNSATGKITEGEGTYSLSRAFLQAGAKNIVSSLWPASENSSYSILSNFIKTSQKMESYTQSLRNSKIQHLENSSPRYQHPYFWANYILTGRTINARNTTAIYIIICIIVLFSLIILKKKVST